MSALWLLLLLCYCPTVWFNIEKTSLFVFCFFKHFFKNSSLSRVMTTNLQKWVWSVCLFCLSSSWFLILPDSWYCLQSVPAELLEGLMEQMAGRSCRCCCCCYCLSPTPTFWVSSFSSSWLHCPRWARERRQRKRPWKVNLFFLQRCHSPRYLSIPSDIMPA